MKTLHLLALGAALASDLAAQAATASGRVVRSGPRGTPLPGRWVVLHEATQAGGGPIDSMRTDAAGHYRLRIPQVKPQAFYQISATHLGIGYFSEPLRADVGTELRFAPLAVYDTAHAGPPIRLARRLLTVGRPERDGTRRVLEILELENPGNAIRITSDTTRPVWAGALPRGAIQFQAGEGDFSPQAVARMGDSVAVFAPLAPDARKQLTYQYVLPADMQQLAVPIDQWTGEVNLLLEDTIALVRGPALDTIGVQDLEGRHFAAYATDSLPAGTALAIALPRAGLRPEALIPWVVGGLAVVLVMGLVVALRKRAAVGGTGG